MASKRLCGFWDIFAANLDGFCPCATTWNWFQVGVAGSVLRLSENGWVGLGWVGLGWVLRLSENGLA